MNRAYLDEMARVLRARWSELDPYGPAFDTENPVGGVILEDFSAWERQIAGAVR